MANRIVRPCVLALVGMPGSGKSLCAEYLQSRGYFQFRFGGIVENEVVRRGWDVIPDNERIVREELRSNEGMDVIAKRALPHLREALRQNQKVVIDGLYSFSEYKTLQHAFSDDMVVVAVAAPRHVRYARLTNRPIRPLTLKEAQERDWREIEALEKGGPIAIADYTLLNDQDTDTLLTRLNTLLETLNF